MKKILFLLLTMASLTHQAQEDKTWRLGLQLGMSGNKSKFSGGLPDADARFVHNPFGAAAIDVIARYDFNKRWKIESGLGVNALGFEFALAQNYSFVNKGKRYNQVKSNIGTLEIPIMVSYKFNPNCRNSKWFISGGVSNVFIGQQKQKHNSDNNNDTPLGNTVLSHTTTVNSGAYLNARLMVGKERVFKKGGILSAALIWNIGFSKLAKSNVEYTIDGNTYQHEFINKGSFFGLRLAYYFRPLKQNYKRQAEALKNNSSSVTK